MKHTLVCLLGCLIFLSPLGCKREGSAVTETIFTDTMTATTDTTVTIDTSITGMTDPTMTGAPDTATTSEPLID